jgi:hypothetical protein
MIPHILPGRDSFFSFVVRTVKKTTRGLNCILVRSVFSITYKGIISQMKAYEGEINKWLRAERTIHQRSVREEGEISYGIPKNQGRNEA